MAILDSERGSDGRGDEPLTAERILDAAEEVLRRYGPAKATVVDVARALGVSHGSVYRHFPSKAALRDAVTERWLERSRPRSPRSPPTMGRRPSGCGAGSTRLVAAKRRKARDDPELFATYIELAGGGPRESSQHTSARWSASSPEIVEDGVADGVFAADDSWAAARAAFDATSRFHNPAHAAEWSDPQIDDAFDGVRSLVLRGLAVPARSPARRRGAPGLTRRSSDRRSPRTGDNGRASDAGGRSSSTAPRWSALLSRDRPLDLECTQSPMVTA